MKRFECKVGLVNEKKAMQDFNWGAGKRDGMGRSLALQAMLEINANGRGTILPFAGQYAES